MISPKRFLFLTAVGFAAVSIAVMFAAPAQADITLVDRPDVSSTNDHYIGNRRPLLPSQFIALPVGSVQPSGWLKEFLNRQRAGLTGHLGEISAWLQKKDNAWLSRNGKGEYGWEELPYWLKGYIELAYLFDDPKMMEECQIWIEGTLRSQRPNGDFGPDQRFEDGSRDYWANMVMLYCLQSYYEHSQDQRVLDLMTKYFAYQMTVPDDEMLTHYWQKMRGGDNLQAIYWLYNRTGDEQLLEVAKKIHRCTANWTLNSDLPNWHNVNIAECFREPAQFYLQSHSSADLQATYNNFREVRQRYGQVPGGMFGGDENCRPRFDDPRQAVETCGMVEQMLSNEMLLQITGDPFWADHCEEVAFNTYPAAVMPDFSALRYLTAPNMVVSDSKNHAPGIENGGPFLMMNPFSSRCCQHNHSHGWPYFAKSLWMATPDNGVLAAMYSASTVHVKVGDGATVEFVEESDYPFEDTIRFTFRSEEPATFPLYLRIPAWCDGARVEVNGRDAEVTPVGGKYVRIYREWTSGDRVVLQLPFEVKLTKWKSNHNSTSVNYGPLTFSLKIGERYVQRDSTETAIGDSSWQPGADPSKWPSFEIFPTTAWNYGLVLDKDKPESSFTVKQASWPANDFPFTTDSAPITLLAKARQIPQWTIDRFGLCGELQDSPVASKEPVETVTLIPMGAARLRISSFPVIGDGPEAMQWRDEQVAKESPYTIVASHTNASDSLEAIADSLEPTHSGDHSIPRFTWWDHRGGKEWVQLEFGQAREVSASQLYWFDDEGVGECRIPQSWKLYYRSGEAWKPVANSHQVAPAKDKWDVIEFDPVVTSALRIEVQLQPTFSGGILEWRVD